MKIQAHQLAASAVIGSLMVGCGGGNKHRLASRSEAPPAAAQSSGPASPTSGTSAAFIRSGEVISTDDLVQMVEQRRRELEAAGQTPPKSLAQAEATLAHPRATGQQAPAPSSSPRHPAQGASSTDSMFGHLGSELSLGADSTARPAPPSGGGEAGRPAPATATAASEPDAGGANSRVVLSEPTAPQHVESPPPIAAATQPAIRTADAQPAAMLQNNSADTLLEKLRQQVKDNPRDLAAHLQYQLYEMVREKPVPDLTAAASLPQEDRELLMAVMDSLSNFRNVVGSGSNLLIGKKMAPLLALEERLRRQAELEIPTIALCTKIDRFGTYTPITPAKFPAGGVNNRFAVYCEVQNFSTQQSADGQWETSLTEESVLYNEAGAVAWQGKPKAVADVSRNRRRDFYCYEVIQLAPTLAPGRYVLKVTITDQQSKRVAEATTKLDVVSNAL